MDTELLKIISDELIDLRFRFVKVRGDAEDAALNSRKTVEKSEEAWELAVMTRNEVRELLYKAPWWKRILNRGL